MGKDSTQLKNQTILDKMWAMSHEQLIFCSDHVLGLKAIISIHNTVLGPAMGGTRMWNYTSEEAAIQDALRLSRGMTFKNSIAGLNIGGGFPIKNSLTFEYDYQYMIDEIINQIKIACDEAEVAVPNIFTEFGSFTVGESGGAIYQILYQKQQNDREKWNMIDSSFITTLPDTWAINKRFIMLAVNRWNDTYERVLLGGLTCDSDDYYNSEQNMNAIYLPKYNKEKPLYIGFFNTGAYQETIGGYGGLHHCLIPQPKHILIDRDENGILATEVFSEQQTSDDVLKILGYTKK